MSSAQKSILANRVLTIALIAVAIDFALKLWVLYNLDAGTIVTVFGPIGLAKIYTVRMSFGSGFVASYLPTIIRFLWLIFLGFMFIRVRRMQSPVLLQTGATLAFTGYMANCIDTLVIPLLDRSVPPFTSYIQLSNFHIGETTYNIAALLALAGFILLFLGIVTSFQSFRALFRPQRP